MRINLSRFVDFLNLVDDAHAILVTVRDATWGFPDDYIQMTVLFVSGNQAIGQIRKYDRKN